MFWFDFNWQIQQFLSQFWWPINFLLVVILVVLGYLAYKKPAYAVGLTIILLPTYLFRSKIWFLPFTFLELCIWVTFAGWLIHRLSFPRRQESNKEKRVNDNSDSRFRGNDIFGFVSTSYKLPILLILIASTISIFVAPNLTAAVGLWKAYFIEPILFFIVLTNVSHEGKNRETILWSLGISTLIISLLAIYQKFTGFGIAEPGWVASSHRRVTSIFTSPNAVGLFLGPIAILYLSWILTDLKTIFKHHSSLLTPTYLLLTAKFLILTSALLAILFTVSQGTWLGLLAAIIFLSFFGWNKKWTTAMVLATIILIILIPTIRNAARPILTFQDPAGQNRLTLLQMSQQYLLTSPKNFILGAGIFGFAEIQNQLRQPLKMEALLYPHNIILNFWLEIGLLGLVGFGWLIIKFFRRGFITLRPAGFATRSIAGRQAQGDKIQLLILGTMAAMVVILVHGLVDVPYFKNDLAVLFWVIIGLLI